MLNNKKIRLMTKLAVYEQNEGKQDIKKAKFYKSDYVLYNVLKTFIAVTFGYLLVLFMIGVYYSEYLISEAVTLDYKTIGIRILAIYIILLILYMVGTIFACGFNYEKSRARLARYYKRLRSLDRVYKDEKSNN